MGVVSGPLVIVAFRLGESPAKLTLLSRSERRLSNTSERLWR